MHEGADVVEALLGGKEGCFCLFVEGWLVVCLACNADEMNALERVLCHHLFWR